MAACGGQGPAHEPGQARPGLHLDEGVWLRHAHLPNTHSTQGTQEGYAYASYSVRQRTRALALVHGAWQGASWHDSRQLGKHASCRGLSMWRAGGAATQQPTRQL